MLGEEYTYLCVLHTDSGELVEEGRMRTIPDDLRRRRFDSAEQMKVAIEIGTHSNWVNWVNRILQECAHEVLVAKTPQRPG